MNPRATMAALESLLAEAVAPPDDPYRALARQLRANGVRLNAALLPHEDHPTVVIGMIRAVPPREGRGTAALAQVCALADELGHAVALSPSGEHGTPQAVLERWYAAHGFTANSGAVRLNYPTWHSMIRPPRTSGATP